MVERVGWVQVLLAAADGVVLLRRRVEGGVGGRSGWSVAFGLLLLLLLLLGVEMGLSVRVRAKARQVRRLLLLLLDVHAMRLGQGEEGGEPLSSIPAACPAFALVPSVPTAAAHIVRACAHAAHPPSVSRSPHSVVEGGGLVHPLLPPRPRLVFLPLANSSCACDVGKENRWLSS